MQIKAAIKNLVKARKSLIVAIEEIKRSEVDFDPYTLGCLELAENEIEISRLSLCEHIDEKRK